MALAQPHLALLWTLRTARIIGPGISQSVLEFGEQNWFGDVAPLALKELIDQLGAGEPCADDLRARLDRYVSGPPADLASFDLAKIFYRLVFGEHAYRAVDLHGTPIAEKCDLNVPLPFSDQFDVVTNLGTAEHIFNQHQMFKSVHDTTKPGGLMIHSLPNQGCYDHGFYNYHPTFVFDLSAANRYQIVTLQYTDATQTPTALTLLSDRSTYVKLALESKLSNYSGLLAVLRRPLDQAPFVVPQQAYYDSQLPPELAAAWAQLPR
jgi:SAM-dependent methyltransferase